MALMALMTPILLVLSVEGPVVTECEGPLLLRGSEGLFPFWLSVEHESYT